MASGGTLLQVSECLPRMRGGGPEYMEDRARYSASSPHARGWSLQRAIGDALEKVFPACAGVVPRRNNPAENIDRLPRMRGGGPVWKPGTMNAMWSSPHARGWSLKKHITKEAEAVFPACAGVVPGRSTPSCPSASLPRMRGGGPGAASPVDRSRSSSPHARGWSWWVVDVVVHPRVFPACAGVVRGGHIITETVLSLPRMRGGGPGKGEIIIARELSSPHARGWSPVDVLPLRVNIVFPACAGVVRHRMRCLKRRLRLPRMRGGGPCRMSGLRSPSGSSPHARGWSVRRVDQRVHWPVFPACAGVVPKGGTSKTTTTSLPRMRGGGPIYQNRGAQMTWSSPHARGWSADGD